MIASFLNIIIISLWFDMMLSWCCETEPNCKIYFDILFTISNTRSSNWGKPVWSWHTFTVVWPLPSSCRVRKFCHWVVNLRHFDNVILVIILISSVLLALEDPVIEKSDRNKVRSPDCQIGSYTFCIFTSRNYFSKPFGLTNIRVNLWHRNMQLYLPRLY